MKLFNSSHIKVVFVKELKLCRLLEYFFIDSFWLKAMNHANVEAVAQLVSS